MTENKYTIKRTLLRSVICCFLVVALVLILRPDLYGLIPNVLDPIYYTGYSINLEDLTQIIGDGHYFVTRWTSYLPVHLFSEILGAYWGRLILRLVLICALAEAIYRFLGQLNYSLNIRWFLIIILLTTPMFVRAFTTDYPEYFIIWAGLVALIISFKSTIFILRTTSIGLLSMSMVIANPATLPLCVLIVLNYLFQIKRDKGIKYVALGLITLSLISGLVVTFGLYYFRFRYDLNNIYEPTLEFIKKYRTPHVDDWRVQGRPWLQYFGWIYLPLIYLGVALLLIRRIGADIKQVLWRCTFIATVSYFYHVYREFTSGHALETSFYWSQLLPPVLLLLLLLMAELFEGTRSTTLLIVLVTILCVYRFQLPQHLKIPKGWPLLLFFVVLFLFIFLFKKKSFVIGSLLLISTIWAQIGVPKYEFVTPGGNLNSPRYDLVYGDQSKFSDQVLRETIWFNEQINKLEFNRDSLFFIPVSDWAYVITGIYAPQLLGRFIPFDKATWTFSQDRIGAFMVSPNPMLIIYGDSSEGSLYLEEITRVLPQLTVKADTTHQGGRGYRLIALTMQ